MEKKKPLPIFPQGIFTTPTALPPSLVFSDDDPIPVPRQSEDYKSEDSLTISLRFCFDHVQLSSSQNQEVPACLFLSNGTPGSHQTTRPGVDIVFIIDLSGSMMGAKLDLLKKTLEFMVSKLGNTDRVSLVTFNNATNKLCPLICMNDRNKAHISRIIAGMKAYGGTEIVQGLDMGLRILAGRRISNSVSSIILLSDGKDNNSHSAMPRTKEILLRALHEIESGFSIHTFGYGADHDATLLNAMAEEKNGGFYFVEHEESISAVFSNCLGELISVIADNVQVSLTVLPTEIPCFLGKIYSESSTGSFRMPPVLSGDTKEAVFMLNFPAFRGILRESVMIEPVKVSISYKVMKSGRSYCEEKVLNVLVHPEAAEIDDIQLDEPVMINFYRVKACDVMKEATDMADRGNIQGAREFLGVYAEELRTCVVSNSEVVVALIRDLHEALGRLSNKAAYDAGGKASMLSKANNHYAKRAVNIGSYQNYAQTSLKVECETYLSKKN